MDLSTRKVFSLQFNVYGTFVPGVSSKRDTGAFRYIHNLNIRPRTFSNASYITRYKVIFMPKVECAEFNFTGRH